MDKKFSLFNRLKEPVVLKEDNSVEQQLNKLKELKPFLNEEGKDLLEMDIKKLEYGIVGEKSILFELKNSHIPMYIIHDLHLSDGENTAQIDYLVFTKKICFVIECKNLYGNIEISEKGEFIRTLHFGKVFKKEAIYSPITQNQRHMDLLKKLNGDKKNNIITKVISNWSFESIYKPIVVLANANSVLNDKKAPGDIKGKVIRADQLIHYIKDMVSESKELAFSDEKLYEWANRFLDYDADCRIDYLAKYERYKAESTKIESTNMAVEQRIENQSVEKEELHKKLKQYRLDKSREEQIKPYYIYSDKQLDDLIKRMPKSKNELLSVSGFGVKKVEKYGDEILEILSI